MLTYKNGSILSVQHGVIVQQVNCQGKMGAGLAKEIRWLYPQVYRDYMSAITVARHEGESMVGETRYTGVFKDPDLFVANMFSQEFCGRDPKVVYTDETAIRICLNDVLKFAKDEELPVHIPYGIGCGLAHGDWKKIGGIIADIFGASEPEVNVTLWHKE